MYKIKLKMQKVNAECKASQNIFLNSRVYKLHKFEENFT